MSTESLQNIAESGSDPSGHSTFTIEDTYPEQKLAVGFAVMPKEQQREIARKGGLERGKQLHAAAMRGESGTARKQ